MKTNTPTLESFCHGAATVLGLESVLSGKPVDPEWVKKVALWKTGLFRIVVMGEIKKGKSSFINALLGHKDLVPVCSDVATSTIFKICYGTEVGYKVFFLPDSEKKLSESEKKKPIAIPASDIRAYGTEDGNPGNKKQVDFIQVFCPSPILKAGLVIVDTPGLGGLFKQHKRITYQYVPKADAVFLVTDSVESPIGQAELDLLADLKKVTKHIFFVQTKSRLVDADAREARKENNLRILSEQAGFEKDKIKYFVVDSGTKTTADEEKDLKKLGRSGFGDVARFVNGYIRPNVQRLLMARAFAEILPKVDAISRELDTQGAILRTKTEDERTAIVESLQTEQQKLKEWETSGKRQISELLDEGLSAIRKEALNSVGRFRPNGALHQEFQNMFSQAESAAQIQNILNVIQAKLGNVLSEELFETQSAMQRACCRLLGEIGRKMNADIGEGGIALDGVAGVSVSSVPVEINRATFFENVRNGFFGGSIGMSIGATVGSIIPFVGTAVGGFVGSIVGSWMSGSSADKHETIAAQNQANAVVAGWLSNCYSDMQQQISDILDQIRRKVNGTVSGVIASAQKNSLDRIDELKQIGQKTNEVITVRSAELQKRQSAFKQAFIEMRGESPVAAKEA